MTALRNTYHLLTPLPDPPPQGAGEHQRSTTDQRLAGAR